MHKYRLVSKIGEGTFSEVLKAQNIKTGSYNAIKCMKSSFDSIEQVNNLREIQALRRLSPHPHVIDLEEVFFDKPTGRLALVFELMHANLYEIIRGRRRYLNPELVRSYIFQLLKALEHMHRRGIFHRDIKPENILTSIGKRHGSGVGEELKLADFGSCRGIYSKQPYTEYISTRWYRAPECLLTDGHYGPEMDMWGVGCVMFEIIALYPLFPGQDELDQIDRIHKVLGTPSKEDLKEFSDKAAAHLNFKFKKYDGWGHNPLPKLVPHASPAAIDLMWKLLQYSPGDRISAEACLRHEYFAGMMEVDTQRSTYSSASVSAVSSSSSLQAANSFQNDGSLPTLGGGAGHTHGSKKYKGKQGPVGKVNKLPHISSSVTMNKSKNASNSFGKPTLELKGETKHFSSQKGGTQQQAQKFVRRKRDEEKPKKKIAHSGPNMSLSPSNASKVKMSHHRHPHRK